jgi:catechol 2,3-dioxygenase-like lactoylglutathione lyase family enzyme
MKQSVSVITLPVVEIDRAKRFYCDTLGWQPVFENEEVVFFQFNGFVLALFLKSAFEKDLNGPSTAGVGSFALGHNVGSPAEVDALMDQAIAGGAALLRAAATLPWGGYSGYIACPDGHAWEIAYNPAWPISEEGYVTFGT